RGRSHCWGEGDADRRRELSRSRAPRRPCHDRADGRRVDPGRPRPCRAGGSRGARVRAGRRGDGRARGRSLSPPERGDGVMTSVEIPMSVAAALPTLSVFDITNDVSRELRGHAVPSGLAYVAPQAPLSMVRVTERESGFFCDLENLLMRLVPPET